MPVRVHHSLRPRKLFTLLVVVGDHKLHTKGVDVFSLGNGSNTVINSYYK